MTVLLLAVVEQPVSVTPSAVSDRPLPVPEAAWLSTKVVLLVTELIVVATVLPPNVTSTMFVPVINMPGRRPVVVAQVTVVEPLVVVQLLSTIAAVWFAAPPCSDTSFGLRLAVAVQAFIAPTRPLPVDPLEKPS